MIPHEEYEKLIAELDRVLEQTRACWLEAPTEKKWRTRIDALLDERLRLMSARDVAATFSK